MGFQCRRTQIQWSESSRGIQDGQGAGAQDVCEDAGTAGSVQAEEEEAQGRPYCCLQLPDWKIHHRVKLFSGVHSGRMKGTGQNTGNSSNTRMGKKITRRWSNTGTSFSVYETSVLGDIQNFTRCSPKQCVANGPALSRRLD